MRAAGTRATPDSGNFVKETKPCNNQDQDFKLAVPTNVGDVFEQVWTIIENAFPGNISDHTLIFRLGRPNRKNAVLRNN